ELGALRINRQLQELDAAGVDPVVYLILPGVLGMAVAATVLAVLFAASAFVSGFVLAFVLGYGRGNLVTAADAAAAGASPLVYLMLLLKSMLIGLAIGVICGQRGLRVQAVTDLPRALAAGFIWSVVAVFVISGSITLVWEFLI
ncbi:MAG: hypothetical protein GVY24_07555, partial [Planctomycetes bacterium]|nr:hypothetical protein [Planctomycetota bacterium]